MRHTVGHNLDTESLAQPVRALVSGPVTMMLTSQIILTGHAFRGEGHFGFGWIHLQIGRGALVRPGMTCASDDSD